MKYLKLIVVLFAFLIGVNKTKAQNNFGTISDFEILPVYLEAGKVKIDPASSTTLVKFSVTYARQINKPTDINISLGTLNSNNQADLFGSNISITNNNFSTGQFIRKDTFTVTIPKVKLVPSHRIYLFTQSADQGSVVIFEYKSYDFSISNLAAPYYVPPVDGAVPLYAYEVRGPSKGLELPDYWYHSLQTNYEGQNVDDGEPVYKKSLIGIIGYIFPTAVQGTVELYRHFKGDDNIYSLSPISPNGYIRDSKVVGYVYNTNNIPKTRPVYQHSNLNKNIHYYVDGPGTFADFRLDGIGFYLLMSPHPNPTYPLPQEDIEEIYQYYSTTGDHFYTTIKKDRPGYTYEKVLGYVHSIQKTGTIPLYRYYTSVSIAKDHYYTTVKDNYNNYLYEGIVGYVYPDGGVNGTTPIYSYYASVNGDHYYNNINANYGGYVNEGIKFWMLQYNH